MDGRVTHYERLGVDRDVTPSELRRAYRQLASRHHPDRNGDDVEGATRRMVEINESFDVLSDPVKRFDYNRSLDRAGRDKATRQDASADRSKQRSQRSRPSRTPAAPADDPVRRARRAAKERAAAEAAKRGYRDPGAGRMNFSAPD